MTSKLTEIQKIVRAELKNLEESGYLIPENEDLEVAMAVEIASRNITLGVLEAIEPDQYIRVDGKFYNKKAVQGLKPKEI